jgi:hypothetical protein
MGNWPARGVRAALARLFPRLVLCVLLLIGPGPGAPDVRGDTVLLLVDETIQRAAADEIAEWVRQVEAEGRFKVVAREVPRTLHLARQRFKRLQEHRALVHELKPDAVQLFGAVAIGVSGWQAADGHEARVVYTDAPYMIDFDTPLTDERAFGEVPGRPSWSNMPGDGRWDQNRVSTFRRPAARVDFSELPEGSWMKVPEGCLKGRNVNPAIDETRAFKEYLKRNLEYRRGAWRPPREAWMQGPLWDLGGGAPRKYARSRMPQFRWVDVREAKEAAGREMFLLFNNMDREHLYEFADSDCRWVRAVWANSYRSFSMEQYELGGLFRRWLERALVSTWGPMWWIIPPEAETVADAIRATANLKRHWDMLYTVAGDVTLPLNPQAAAQPAGE